MSSSRDTVSCDVLVLGAGVIGLAIAAELAARRNVIVLELHSQFGQETSSRNSEVIHSGIYYPIGSRKTEWCIEGRGLLYAYCEARAIPYRRCGKMVVATESSEEAFLERLTEHCKQLGVPHRRLSHQEIGEREARVAAIAGIFFPETGIIDSHLFMASLERQVEEKAVLAYSHRAVAIRNEEGGWVTIAETPSGRLAVRSRYIVNAAGLAAAELSNLALGTDRYEHRFCRGTYLQLSNASGDPFKHLIYPVPEKHGLGIHVTIDTEGQARLGPDVEWCKAKHYRELGPWYDADWEARRQSFALAVQKYLPGVRAQDLSPGLIGIRPKLFINGAACPDFLVENKGGFIHCLGIESPGLTAALAIARTVSSLI